MKILTISIIAIVALCGCRELTPEQESAQILQPFISAVSRGDAKTALSYIEEPDESLRLKFENAVLNRDAQSALLMTAEIVFDVREYYPENNVLPVNVLFRFCTTLVGPPGHQKQKICFWQNPRILQGDIAVMNLKDITATQ